METYDDYELIVGTLDSKTATRLIDDPSLSTYFDRAVEHCAAFWAFDNAYWQKYPQSPEDKGGKVGSTDIRSIIAGFIFGELSRLSNTTGVPIADSKVKPVVLGELVARFTMPEVISAGSAKKLLEIYWDEGGSLTELIKRENLIQVSDPETIKLWIAEVIASSEKVVATYKSGKTQVFGGLMGAVLKKGKAHPVLAKELLLEALTTT